MPIPTPDCRMHYPNNLQQLVFTCCLTLLATASGNSALAQSTPATPASGPIDDEIVELSPFVITADSDTGWVATESLSGSRMKTPIKDLAQPIEVMTMEFMQDLGVRSFEQAIIYSTNIEGPSELTEASGR